MGEGLGGGEEEGRRIRKPWPLWSIPAAAVLEAPQVALPAVSMG